MLEVARTWETSVQNSFLSGNFLENGSVEDLSFGWEEDMKNRLMEIVITVTRRNWLRVR